MSDETPAVVVRLGDLEREVMEVMWFRAEASVRDVLETLNADGDRSRAYTTIMTVMGNLVRKGLLLRRREGRTDIYRVALARESYADARARHEIEALVSRYGDVALAHFAREVDRLSPEHRRELRELVDDE